MPFGKGASMQRELLAAIIAEPDEEARRLVYADWLEDRGDPLAELTRLQVFLQRELPGPARREGFSRVRALLAGLDPEGRAVPRLGREGDWSFDVDRGLVTLRLRPAKDLRLPPRSWFDRFGCHAVAIGHGTPALTDRALAALLATDTFGLCVG